MDARIWGIIYRICIWYRLGGDELMECHPACCIGYKTNQLLASDGYTGVKPHPVWPYWFWWYAQKAWFW